VSQAAPEISVGVVIPAAGSGERLGGQRKQFRLLSGKPLLVQTALAFERHPRVAAIVIAAPQDGVTEIESLCQDFGLSKVSKVVAGGQIRQDSVRIGLNALPDETTIVITHDAVRPFVAADDIDRVVEEAARSGAASTVATVSDTLCRSNDQLAGETVPRDGLFRMLTPQCFRREILERAHEMATDEFTDEVTIVRAAGYDVTMVETSPINIKITTQSDWDLAAWMWPAFVNRAG